MIVNYVRQHHRSGCTVAVLAMLMGVDYSTALQVGREHGLSTGGSSDASMQRTIFAYGGSVRVIKAPCEPFAPMHYVLVSFPTHDKDVWHVVAMTKGGRVLEPDPPEGAPFEFDSLAEYLQAFDASVRCVVGVWWHR